MQLVKVRPLGWAVVQYEWCPIKRENLNTHTHGAGSGESHVKIKAEDAVMLRQVKEYQRLPQTTRRKERDMQRVCPHSPQKEPILPTPWFQSFIFQNDETVNTFLWCKSCSLWCLVTAAPVSSYSGRCSSSPLFHPAARGAG